MTISAKRSRQHKHTSGVVQHILPGGSHRVEQPVSVVEAAALQCREGGLEQHHRSMSASRHDCSQQAWRAAAATTMRTRLQSTAWRRQTRKAAAARTHLQRPAQLGEWLQAQQVEEDLRKGAFQVGQQRDLGRPATQPQLMGHEPGIQAPGIAWEGSAALRWASTEDMDCGQTCPGAGKTCRRCRWACGVPMKPSSSPAPSAHSPSEAAAHNAGVGVV